MDRQTVDELEKKSQFPTISLKKEVPANWNVRYETPAGKAWPRETPQGERRGGSLDRPRKASAWSGNHYTYPLSGIRSLSADCLPSLFTVSGCGVLATQLFGRSPANFFHPLRITVKKHQGSPILKFGSG